MNVSVRILKTKQTKIVESNNEIIQMYYNNNNNWYNDAVGIQIYLTNRENILLIIITFICKFVRI